ncbi:MAG TPA: hypothetical protein VD994_04730 [Prosthecobacter sp.]|nr:hypothetical protein [Prosthecobacter sp.]
MNSSSERHESFSEAARHALQDIKQATRERLLQPLTEGGRQLAHKAQSGCHAMAQSTRQDFERIECWAAQYPTRSLGLAFAAGVLLGISLFRH